MTAAELIAEGEAIARPAFVLGEQPTGSGVVAYWGGVRADRPEQYPPQVTALAGRRHVCTVGEGLLGRLDIFFARPTGPVSVFEIEDAEGNVAHHAEGDGRLQFSGLSFVDAIPLYATAIRSFPPFAAVCCHGGERVGDWLAARGFARHDYWRAGTPSTGQAYDDEWQRRSPFYDPAAVAVVGGWHMLWPEDDFYVPPECRLLFMTQRDAEPWYEVWHGAASGGLRVRERIT